MLENSHKKAYKNPYEKEEIASKKIKIKSTSDKKQPKSCAVSNKRSSSNNNSGQRSPLKQDVKYNMVIGYKKKSDVHSGNLRKNKNNLSTSFDSADDFDTNLVYVDTGGSNMQ